MHERLTDYVKHRLIGTPAEPLARMSRSVRDYGRAILRPGLRAVLVDEPAAIVRVFDRAITPTTNCVDVGAHLGATTYQFVRRAPNGRHLSVEPTPYKARWLRRAFPEVEVAEIALSCSSGNANFFHQPQASGYSGLREHLGGAARAHHTQRSTVRTQRLDDVVPVERRVGFVKVDTEGGDADVLRGASRILERDRPLILFECTLSGTRAFGSSPTELYEFLSSKGYRVWTPQDYVSNLEALSLTAFESCTIYPFRSFNFVAAPRLLS